ncbi:MAG: hypothetical protein G8345_17365 [Magnetococcales bacterium]|nr:hypothetical protein [Magnetococcales bacterium]NGZ28648.1 hypothetical protein [Magnetococcales bacterium]
MAMETARTLGGTLVTWSPSLTGDQPITLEATENVTWLTQAQVAAFMAIASKPGEVFYLIWESHMW